MEVKWFVNDTLDQLRYGFFRMKGCQRILAAIYVSTSSASGGVDGFMLHLGCCLSFLLSRRVLIEDCSLNKPKIPIWAEPKDDPGSLL